MPWLRWSLLSAPECSYRTNRSARSWQGAQRPELAVSSPVLPVAVPV
jgi:hypothetical protein